jgi:hypothetical protein
MKTYKKIILRYFPKLGKILLNDAENEFVNVEKKRIYILFLRWLFNLYGCDTNHLTDEQFTERINLWFKATANCWFTKEQFILSARAIGGIYINK